MACSPAASECPASETGAGAPSIVTDLSQWDSVSAAGQMPMPISVGGLPEYGLLPQGIFANQFGGAPLQQVARPDGLLQAPLQAGGAADPNALPQLLLMQNQQHLQQCMQLMQHQALLLGQGQQTQTASAPAGPRKRSRNNAKRPQKAERERQKQAWIVAQSTAELEENRRSQEVQGNAPAPQCRSDAESWIEVDTAAKVYVDEQISALKLEREALVAELANVRSSMEASIIDAVEGAVRKVMDTIEKEKAEVQAQMKTMVTRDEMAEMPEVEPEGALQKVTEEMEEHRKQFEHLSKVVSALREDMAERFAEKDAAVAQLASEQSVLRASVDKLPLKMEVVQKSLDDERQARTKSMEAMTEKMATKMEEINEQSGQLQRDATANMEAMVEKMVAKREVQEMATKEWFNEQLGQLQRDATAYMEAMAEKMATKTEVQEERMATTEWVNEQLGLQVDTTANMEAKAEKMATTIEVQKEKMAKWVNEQLGELQRDATANMEAMVEEMATKIEVQVETMATTEWVNEQLRQLQRDATARMEAMATTEWVNEQVGQLQRDATARMDFTVQDAVESAVADGPEEELHVLQDAVPDGTAELNALSESQAVQATVESTETPWLEIVRKRKQNPPGKLERKPRNPHDFDVFVYLYGVPGKERGPDGEPGKGKDGGHFWLVQSDGSLLGPEERHAFSWKWKTYDSEVEDVEGLKRLVEKRLPKGKRWTYVSPGFLRNLRHVNLRDQDGPLKEVEWHELLDRFQDLLRSRRYTISEAHGIRLSR